MFRNFLIVNSENHKLQLFYSLFFFVFTIVVLSVDSTFINDKNYNLQFYTNCFVILYFALIYTSSGEHLKKLMLVMLFLSYIGEVIFCSVLHMYDYRCTNIPLYVPFGHAIVYASGYILSKTSFAIKNQIDLRAFFWLFFISIFLVAIVFFNDWFTLVLAPLFFVLLNRKKSENLYFFIAICVVFIEFVGTFFECWTWKPKVLALLPTANPPVGIVFVYAAGDVLLAKIVSKINKKI